MGLLDYLQEQGIDLESSGGIVTAADNSQVEVVINPNNLDVTVAENDRKSVLVLHTKADSSRMVFDVHPCASLRVVDVYLGGCFAESVVRQQAGSVCDITSVVTSGAVVDYMVDMNGKQASNALKSIFLSRGEEYCKVAVRVNHNYSDCTSNSLVKGVASGKSKGEFNGMVYVAQDAQRTDARQNSRNIELGGEAKIITKPQLEIYADDVKCSHGATVGQLDSEAILYMRQRGLSEMQARRLQIEGFAKDIVYSSSAFGDVLAEELNRFLEEI
ncbi:MAG: SufD family Fe-S cluster assembly protein [Alistipes sp.]|nr:SufD family Fe-S cluster assembly protein [Alistipes sp.]